MLHRFLLFASTCCLATACSHPAPMAVTKTRAPIARIAPIAASSGSSSVASARPEPTIVPPEDDVEDNEWTRVTRDEPRNEKDTCEVANRNIQAAIDAVLQQKPPTGNPMPRQNWSGQTLAGYQKLVEGRFALTKTERSRLNQNGFVVLGRLARVSFAHAYHDIYQSQLPVYVTMDSLFHAVFKAHEALMIHIEQDLLAPRFRNVITALRETLKKTGASLPPETHRDVDLYLAVAASLLAAQPKAGVLNDVDTEVKSILDAIEKADGLLPIDMFGRTRMVDFSQYRPRGHYATHETLIPYFKTMMWVSRLELNLVSRSSRSSAPGASPDPRETPREAKMAITLGQLVEQANAGSAIAEIEQTLQALGGKREDVNASEVLSLYRQSGAGKLDDPQTFEAFKRAIGSGYVRTARLHYMPQGSTDLPVIFSLMGPRVTPDTTAQRPLVNGDTPNRFDLQIADMAYVLGHDQAREYLQADLARFPTLSTQLDRARHVMSDIRGEDLYSTWLLAIGDLSKQPPPTSPSFMKSKPFRDLRINSTVAAYGQLRRNNVLIGGQTYSEGGCEIPDGYVEPAPDVLDHLISFSERASALLAKLGEAPPPETRYSATVPALFPRMKRMFKALRRIVDREIAGESLTEPEKRLLATVAEIVPATSSSPAMYTGWYFQLFESRRGALENPSFIGDYYTSTNTGQVAYAGAADPELGIFVVDVSGAPRMMLGPVAHGYELHAPLSQRLTDEEGRLQPNKISAWATSYRVEQTSPPTMRLFEDAEHSSETTKVYKVRTKEKIGVLKLEVLTHHGQPCGEGQTNLAGTHGELRLKLTKPVDDDACTGGYRLTVDGRVFNMDMNDWPTEMGLGDMWDLELDQN